MNKLIGSEKANYPVSLMCRALEVQRSSFYAYVKRSPSTRSLEDQQLVAEIRRIHRASRSTYGSPRVHAELKEKKIAIGRHRVARLMRKEGITARFKRPLRRTTESNHSFPTTQNLLARNFSIKEPNRAWVTDITYLRTEQGWLFLAVVIDLFSRRVVGWSMADHLRTELVLSALNMAKTQRTISPGLVHHSDRGCQYASNEYRKALSYAGIRCSMSRKGDCWDNAVAESFFGTLKTELAHRSRWKTRSHARTAIFEYIEVFYNRKRRHSYLGYLSPAQYEDRYLSDLSRISN